MKSSTNTCRLCYEEEEDITKLTSPCNCKGSIQHIHIRCLRLMKREPRYKYQCPTCKLPWKQIVLPGSSVEHAIDLTGFERDAGMLDVEPDEAVRHTIGLLYNGPDYTQRRYVFDQVDLDIEPEEGVAHTMRWRRNGGTAARRFGKTHI